MAQVQGSPAWSDLPPEVLGLVFLRLPTRADRAFFPAVCRAWCSAARQCQLPLPSPVPWLLLPDGSATSFPRGETFQLPEGVRYHTSNGEWLVLSRVDGSCFLMNHVTGATMPLPSLSSYRYYEEPVDVAEDCMVHEGDMQGTWMFIKDISEDNNISVLSLVVCSPRLIAAVVGVGGLGTIALCRPGSAAWSVSAIECRLLSYMVFLQGKLYALDRTTGPWNDLNAINIVDEHDNDELRVSRIECVIKGISLPPPKHLFYMPYLVVSHGTLLMIRRTLSQKIDYSKRGKCIFVAGSSEFEVFKADFEGYLWAETRTLGNDQAVFLGRGCSRAVHVSPHDLSRDCVFFLDDYTNSTCKKTTTSCGVYDMKDETIYSALPMVSWESGEVSATWIFSV